MAQAVVVTGLGTIGSYGCGARDLGEALRCSSPRLSEVDRSAGYHRADSARSAALLGSLDLSAWVAPAAARRMSPPSKFAVAAARMALCDAGLESGVNGAGLTGVVIGTAFGPTSFTEKLMRGILLEGPETASPFLFTECVANAPAAQVAIACKAMGPNIAITQREAGPLLAVARGAGEVASGRVIRALVGSVEEMPPILHAVLDRFGALTHEREDGAETARPFDAGRSGFLAAEGATMLVLEAEAAATARGARPLARVTAWGSAFDPTATRTSWGQGSESLGESLSCMLSRAGLTPADIDLVVSGASGARAGDRLEALALLRGWRGVPLPPVLAPKGALGEYGGGFLGAAVLASSGAEFGPTRGFRAADPALGVVPHRGGALGAPRRVLVSSLAAGGAAAWLVLERP